MEDDQAHGLVKVPALVARFAGQPQLEGHVRAAVAAHQRSSMVANLTVATAKLLEFVVLGHGGVRDALRWGVGSPPQGVFGVEGGTPGGIDPASAALLQEVVEVQDMPLVEAVGKFGRSCRLPGNWQAIMHCLLTAPGYAQAVDGNILAGMRMTGCCFRG